MNITSILMVGAGGFFGSIARYITVQLIDRNLNSIFPYGTLAVNVFGSFILGLIFGLMQKHVGSHDHWKLFLTTGFCGGFTTFSAFAFENVNFLQQRMMITSLSYILISIIASFAAVIGGIFLAKVIA
jgi:CrcB protein